MHDWPLQKPDGKRLPPMADPLAFLLLLFLMKSVLDILAVCADIWVLDNQDYHFEAIHVACPDDILFYKWK